MAPLTSILILLAALLSVFWQSAFNGLRHLLGAQVDLLPALMVYTSLSAGLPTVILTAVSGGLLFDTLSANPLGVSVLPLLAVGVALYSQRELILRDQFFAQVILGLSASAFVPVATVLIILSMGRAPLIGWGSLWQWTVISIGGAVAAPIWFQLFGLFDRALNYRRAIETTFRPDREIRRGRR